MMLAALSLWVACEVVNEKPTHLGLRGKRAGDKMEVRNTVEAPSKRGVIEGQPALGQLRPGAAS